MSSNSELHIEEESFSLAGWMSRNSSDLVVFFKISGHQSPIVALLRLNNNFD